MASYPNETAERKDKKKKKKRKEKDKGQKLTERDLSHLTPPLHKKSIMQVWRASQASG